MQACNNQNTKYRFNQIHPKTISGKLRGCEKDVCAG